MFLWNLNYPRRIFSLSCFNGCFAKHTANDFFTLSSFWTKENPWTCLSDIKLQTHHRNGLCKDQIKPPISLSAMLSFCSDYCTFPKCKHRLFITGIAQQPTEEFQQLGLLLNVFTLFKDRNVYLSWRKMYDTKWVHTFSCWNSIQRAFYRSTIPKECYELMITKYFLIFFFPSGTVNHLPFGLALLISFHRERQFSRSNMKSTSQNTNVCRDLGNKKQMLETERSEQK